MFWQLISVINQRPIQSLSAKIAYFGRKRSFSRNTPKLEKDEILKPKLILAETEAKLVSVDY